MDNNKLTLEILVWALGGMTDDGAKAVNDMIKRVENGDNPFLKED
jgi:hypothetical protein